MGFQVNGVEYVNNSGHFTNGLKTVNNTALTGTGTVTTGNAATWGTDFNVVGSMCCAYLYQNFNASGNYGLSSGYQRKGIEQGSTIAGSSMYTFTYPGSGSYYYWLFDGITKSGYSSTTQSNSTSYFSGTWRCISSGFEDPSYTWQVVQLFIRIS